MGRNKLSAHDRIKKFSFYENKVKQCKGGDPNPIMKEIKTLRSKTLRVFCAFWLSQLEEFNFVHTHSIKELSKAVGIGERTIHDYIKARKILSGIDEVAFNGIFDAIGKNTDPVPTSEQGKNKLPPNNSTQLNEQNSKTNKE